MQVRDSVNFELSEIESYVILTQAIVISKREPQLRKYSNRLNEPVAFPSLMFDEEGWSWEQSEKAK